jgi:hypothetical protein
MAGPSPNALFQFQKDNRARPWLRITSDSGLVERQVLRLDRVGLHDLSTPEGGRVPGPMTWDRIRRIDEVVTRAAPWRTAGMVTIGLLGAGLGNALGAPSHTGGRMALAGAMAFGGVGGYVGSAYGSRFRSERNWYVADSTPREQPATPAAAAESSAVRTVDPAVLRACERIGRNELFRAKGTFGTFRGYAGIAGPGGLEELREDPPGRTRDQEPAPASITWDQVDRIDVRGGSAMTGAVSGGLAFGAVGALLGMAAIAVAGENSDVSVPEGGLIGAVYVAPVGIVLGGLIGLAARHWVNVYRRP